ncbi:MAG TPA: hypothetical protein PK109_01220 [Candidatus Paceibacterota bacterium]|nr:hypothetical protein [Candidatus Paceibacterota bacterium]
MGEGWKDIFKFGRSHQPESVPSVVEKNFAPLTAQLDTELAQSELKDDALLYEAVGGTVGMVAAESTALAHQGDSAYTPQSISALRAAFVEAGTKAAGAFKDIFTYDETNGNTVVEGSATETAAKVKEAKGQPKFINAQMLPRVVNSIDPTATPESIASAIEKADFFAVRTMVAKMLGMNEQRAKETQRDAAGTQQFLKTVLKPDDYFLSLVDTIKEPGAAPSVQDVTTLELGFRLANVTWASGQPLIALYEGENSERGNSEKQDNFRAFDDMVAKMYNEGGLDRATFEVMKDLEQLKEFVKQVREAETKA